LLDDPNFREDSVREVLIVPLLAALGFSEAPPYRILRSKRLEHPFVYIGTVKKNVTIIPDYVLERDGEMAWILDAKGPDETIDSGKNVEQAYSYAIHPDIRVPLYGLCNGRKPVVFHVSEGPPVIDVALEEIHSIWPIVLGILGCRPAWPHGIPPGFHPDMGLALAKAGLDRDENGTKYWQTMMGVRVRSVTRIEDDLYSVTGVYGGPDTNGAYSVTFDFGPDVLPKFVAALPEEIQEAVTRQLKHQPYSLAFHPHACPIMMMTGDPGDKVIKNDNESYQPFIGEDFAPDFLAPPERLPEIDGE